MILTDNFIYFLFYLRSLFIITFLLVILYILPSLISALSILECYIDVLKVEYILVPLWLGLLDWFSFCKTDIVICIFSLCIRIINRRLLDGNLCSPSCRRTIGLYSVSLYISNRVITSNFHAISINKERSMTSKFGIHLLGAFLITFIDRTPLGFFILYSWVTVLLLLISCIFFWNQAILRN